MALPRLKSLTCAADGERLVVMIEPRIRVELADPTGAVLALLRLLMDGTRDLEELALELSTAEAPVTAAEVGDAIAELDALGWLEDADAPVLLTDVERERYFSNLGFFDGFTNLSRSREGFQDRLRRSHVLVLGAGGLGSSVVQNLVGLGVGRLTVLDQDVVELRNFARQFTYTPAQLGLSKVEQVAGWVRAFDPGVDVTAINREVVGPETVTALLDGVDLVIHAIDTPADVDDWVNQACVEARVPFVRGGLAYLRGLYWSVDPGRSACRQCLFVQREREAPEVEVLRWRLPIESVPVNRAIGPVATMLGALVAMEGLRYLTRFTAPVAGGTYHLIDFTGDCRITTESWPREPRCPTCAGAGVRQPDLALALEPVG